MPQSSLVIDIVEIRRRPGTRRDVDAELELGDLTVGERTVVDGRLGVAVTIESVLEGVVAAGTVTGTSRVPCRRCLDDVDQPIDSEFREIFEREPTEGETWPLGDDQIDLTPVVREVALLALPLAPLCRADCQGPDVERFPTGVAPEPDPDVPAPRDDRWAALDELVFDDES